MVVEMTNNTLPFLVVLLVDDDFTYKFLIPLFIKI